MDHKYAHSSQNYAHSLQNYSTTPTRVVAPLKKVQVVYYLSYEGGLLEQPHLLEVSLCSSRGLSLRDVKTRLTGLRGAVMSSSFSWSYKRSYREGFVWQDLESDDDLIFPTHSGSEYVMKGCRIESSRAVAQMPPSASKMSHNLREIVQGISTPLQPVSGLAELPALPTATQSDKAINSVAINEHANPIMIRSPSNSSLHGSDDNITFNLGIIEGLEHLHLAKANDPRYADYAESQASTYLNLMEQSKKTVQNHRQSKEPSVSNLKGSIIAEVQQYAGSLEFSVIKKVEEKCGTSSNPSLFVGTDVATQTGEDDDISDKHGKGKAFCLPDFYHTDQLPCPKSREGSFQEQRGCLQRTLVELSREEISPPPCSTSSSSTTMSAHSASSSNVVGCSVDPLRKLSFNQSSSCLAEDQNHKETESVLSSRVLSDKETLLEYDEEALATKSTLDSECQSGTTPSCQSADLNENSSSDAVDHSCKNPKSVLNSSKVKPHVMSICSSSGRFLQLVSCGKGLEVIKPSDMRIRRCSSMSGVHTDDCDEASAREYSSLQNAKAKESSCLDLSSPNIVDSCFIPTTAPNDVPDNVFNDADGNLLKPAPQDGNSRIKKLWHLSGWVHSHYKKRKGTIQSKSISTNSGADEDTYAYLDLFEKHAVTNSSADGLNAEDSSPQCMLISVGSAGYSSSSHQRGSNYGSNSSVNFMNEWVASPLQRPELSRGSIMSSYTSSKYGDDGGESNNLAGRSSFPVYGLETFNAKEGSPTLQKHKNYSRRR